MPKTFFNENLLPKVASTIDKFKADGKETFLTIEAIENQLGRFICDNCSPDDSFNANFGRFLKNNMDILGIEEVEKDVKVNDKYNNSTSCSRWEIIK